MAISGSLIGEAWSTLGIYLNPSVLYRTYEQFLCAIGGLFLALALLLHGSLLSHASRVYLSFLFLIIVFTTSFPTTSASVTPAELLYPVIVVIDGKLLAIILIFPEFSSNFLCGTTNESLNETSRALTMGRQYLLGTDSPRRVVGAFIKPSNPFRQNPRKSLSVSTAAKVYLR